MHRTTTTLFVVLTVLVSSALWADKPAWVIPDVLYVRAKPGTDSDKIGNVTRGDQVVVTSFTDDHWCKALLPNGTTGWVSEEYLMFSAEKGREIAKSQGKTPMAVPAWVDGRVVNVRSKPDVGSSVATRVKQGQKLYIIDTDGNWRKIKTSGGDVGWIRSDLLELNIEKGRKLAGTSAPAASEPSPAWVNTNVANLRKGPSTGYSRVGQFTKGTKVYITETKSDWVKCKGPDGEGWMHSDLLETDVEAGRKLVQDTGSSGRDKAYCIGNNVALRSGPSTGKKRVSKLLEGATLWILDEKDGWCKVETEGGDTGWIAGWYVRRHGAGRPVAKEPEAPPLVPPGDDFPSPSREPEEGKLQPFTAWIADDSTNVRAGPSTGERVKFKLNKHDKVTVVDADGQWCQVRTGAGAMGWIAGWVLDFQPPGTPEATKLVDGRRVEVKAGWVDGTVVNVRAERGTGSDVVGTVRMGEELVIVDRDGDWYRVVLGDGKMGWIHDDLVETRAERMANGNGGDLSQGQQIAQEAMGYLGRPYVRGAEGPRSFDCSGFTQYIHGKFGISLRRTSDGQYRQGRPVDRDSLQLGDVVIFRNTYKSGISHVGIYIGQGNFVHASNSRGGVKISALDSSYYAPRYAGARRMW